MQQDNNGTPHIDDRTTLLAEAREKLRLQRSEDRNVSDLHYRTRTAWENTKHTLDVCKALQSTIASLAEDVGHEYEALNVTDEAAIKKEIGELEQDCVAQQARLDELRVTLKEKKLGEETAQQELSAVREKVEQVIRETAEMEQLGDTALQVDQELAAVAGELKLRVSTLGSLQSEVKSGSDLIVSTGASVKHLKAALQDQHAVHSTVAAELSESHTHAHVLREHQTELQERVAVEKAHMDAALEEKHDEADAWKRKQLIARRAMEETKVATQKIEHEIVALHSRMSIAQKKMQLLQRRDELADAVQAQQRYKHEIVLLEKELSQRPKAEELPGRCELLEAQCEKLCEELNRATEDLQLLQCGLAESRFTEMSLAFDSYKNETIPAVQKRCGELKGEVYNKRVAKKMWEEEKQRHQRFDDVLQDDKARLKKRLEVAKRARAARELEEEEWARERLQWEEQRRVWEEEDRSISEQIKRLEDGTEDSDVVVEVVEEHVGRDNVRTTKRRLLVQPATKEVEVQQQERPAAHHLDGSSVARPHFNFFAVKLLSTLARVVRRPFQRRDAQQDAALAVQQL